METYYENENYKLYKGDVLKILKTIPDESIDMVFTSPPYNLNISKSSGDFSLAYDNYNDNMEYNEYIKWQLDILNELYRVIKKDGYLFYNHKERWIDGDYRNPIFYIKESKWNISQSIIWYRKACFNFTTGKFGNTYENIYLLYKEQPPKLLTKHSVLTDVWEIPPEKNNKHPAPFPLELPLRAIYSIYDDQKDKVILDCFSGSGTTGVASLLLEHKYIGIDISEKYLEMSKDRIDNYKKEARKGQKEVYLHRVENEYNTRKIDNQMTIFDFEV